MKSLLSALLSDALQEWGIGGKTNAGDGRLVPENPDEISLLSIRGISRFKIRAFKHRCGRPEKQFPPTAKKLKYKKGDIVEVTKIADPKEKRERLLFRNR